MENGILHPCQRGISMTVATLYISDWNECKLRVKIGGNALEMCQRYSLLIAFAEMHIHFLCDDVEHYLKPEDGYNCSATITFIV